jgi:prepilin-type N-terminal cleavage/methylation domain-containing protein
MIRRNEVGFSLIEVLISLTILSVGLLAVAGMQITSIKGNFSSGNVTNATVLAQSKLEDLKSLSYTDSNITSGQHSEGAISGSIFSMFYDVADITSTMKAITVTVRWKDMGDHSISLSTIRAK